MSTLFLYLSMILTSAFIVNSKDLPVGTILISRNNDDTLNHHIKDSKWNHICIYIGNGIIVESQEDQGVIKTSAKDYLKRDYTFGFLYPKNKQQGIDAAKTAEKLVGSDYRKVSSVFRRNVNPKKGLNCVSVVRNSYNIYLQIPDDILKFSDLFTDKISETK